MKRINSYKYHGNIQACSSKSHAQRILILGLLTRSEVFIEQFFETEVGTDVQHMMGVCKQLGYKFKQTNAGTLMKAPDSAYTVSNTSFLIGESGFALRTLSAILSNFTDTYTIHGHKSILTRDHKELIESLQNIGLNVISKNHKLPFEISNKIGPLDQIHIDGSNGSQFISGILMLSPFIDGDTKIQVSNVTSRPYIDLTRHTIKQFNGTIKGTETEFIIPGNQKLKAASISLEGDWSNVSFHLVGAALKGEVSVSGLNMNSTQGDKIILDVLEDFGAKVELKSKDTITILSAFKKPFQVDLTDSPDLFPILSVLACGAEGASSLIGIQRLTNKESNRLRSICEMLDVFKVRYHLKEDTLTILGTGCIQGGEIKTYEDHRMAMSAICAGTISSTTISIDNEDCIEKSYRNYFEQMDSILNYES